MEDFFLRNITSKFQNDDTGCNTENEWAADGAVRYGRTGPDFQGRDSGGSLMLHNSRIPST